MNRTIKIMVILGFIFCEQIILGYSPAQLKLFKQALQKTGQVVNCANCDFRGVHDLAGVDAHGAFMPGVTFQPCIATADNKNLIMVCTAQQMADLTGINLASANLFSSCFDWAILDKADLTGADFSNSSVRNVTLKDAKVAKIITTNATFCNSIMPDGAICKDSWTGQGVTIACNCTAQDQAA